MLSESVVAVLFAACSTLVEAQKSAANDYPLNPPVNGETGGSLSAQPTIANADITSRGSDWLWAAFAIMLASGVGVLAWGLSRPVGTRAFHYIGVMILFTASIAYFTMASNLGSTPIYVEFVRYRGDLFTDTTISPYTRSIWYVRYIDWVVTTPLLLLELLLATGLPLSDIIVTVFFDEVMIIGGLIGALVASRYKWGYFAGACAAEIFITWMLLVPARKSAKALGATAHRAYTTSALALGALWFLYPIAWGLADGGNVISPDSEMIFYGVLDVVAKPMFLIYHLFSIRKVPYESFQLQSGHFSAYASVPNGQNYNHKIQGNGPISQHRVPDPDKTGPGAHSVPAGNAPVQTSEANVGVTPHGAPGTNTLPGQMYPVNGAHARPSDATAV